MEGRANFYRFAHGQRQILVDSEVCQLIGYEMVIFFGMAQVEARIAAAMSATLLRVLEISWFPTSAPNTLPANRYTHSTC